MDRHRTPTASDVVGSIRRADRASARPIHAPSLVLRPGSMTVHVKLLNFLYAEQNYFDHSPSTMQIAEQLAPRQRRYRPSTARRLKYLIHSRLIRRRQYFYWRI